MNKRYGGVGDITNNGNLPSRIPGCIRSDGTPKQLTLMADLAQLKDRLIMVHQNLASKSKSETSIWEPFNGLAPPTKASTKKMGAIPPKSAVQLRPKVHRGRVSKVVNVQLR